MFDTPAEEPLRIQAVARSVEDGRDVGSGGPGRVRDYAAAADDGLVAAIAARDHRALEVLYDRYGDYVYSVALRVVQDAQVAEDVVQEVFIRLWRRPEMFDETRGRFVTWLLSMARNRAIDERRRRGRRFRHESSPTLDEQSTFVDDSEDPVDAAVLSDERTAVKNALGLLPLEQRRVIELAYFGGMTQEEIARALSQPLGTVKTRIRLGLQKLRVMLIERKD